MLNEKTDYEKILSDFNDIQSLKEGKQIVMLTKYPECNSHNKRRQIGKKTSKFTYENYHIRYRECDKEENWQIKLLDDSLISYFYEFDSSGRLLQYSLSFIPAFDEGQIVGGKEDWEVRETLTPCFNDYLRIDFSEVGYKKAVHEKQHLHKGLVERNKTKKNKEDLEPLEDSSFRHELRLPINKVIFPLDFLYLIIKYIYDNQSTININKEFERRDLIQVDEQDFSIDNSFFNN